MLDFNEVLLNMAQKNFILVIYYKDKDPAVILTDIETEGIKSFPFDDIYHSKKEANSLLDYKHTIKAIRKMKLRLKDKTKHPMYGKKNSIFALEKIRKPGVLNSMFSIKHTIETKKKMSLAKSKTPLALYSIKNNLIKTFINQVELAQYLNLNKSTIGRYLKSGKTLLGKFIIRKFKE